MFFCLRVWDCILQCMLTILSYLSLVDVDSKVYSGSVQGVESISKTSFSFYCTWPCCVHLMGQEPCFRTELMSLLPFVALGVWNMSGLLLGLEAVVGWELIPKALSRPNMQIADTMDNTACWCQMFCPSLLLTRFCLHSCPECIFECIAFANNPWEELLGFGGHPHTPDLSVRWLFAHLCIP